MKPESFKAMHGLMDVVRNMDILPYEKKFFTEELQRIIRIETPQKYSKFNFWNYVYDQREAGGDGIKGIYHDGGFKVATNLHVIAAIKESYPEEFEGKILKKNGALVEATGYNRYPDWKMVANRKIEDFNEVTIDIDKVLKLYEDARAKAKRQKEDIELYFVKLNDSYFKLEHFRLFVVAMRHIHTDKMFFKKGNIAIARTEEGTSAIAALYGRPNVEPNSDKIIEII